MSRKTTSLPTQAYVSEMLDYCPATGVCIWKERPRSHFRTDSGYVRINNNYPGKQIGCMRYSKDGRPTGLVVVIDNKQFMLHRLIWVLMNNDDPGALHVDHINGDPFDNRIANLRLANKSENRTNSVTQKNNTSGYKGVTAHIRGGWKAQITANKRHHYLGIFNSPEEAHAAYCKAAQELHGEFARP